MGKEKEREEKERERDGERHFFFRKFVRVYENLKVFESLKSLGGNARRAYLVEVYIYTFGRLTVVLIDWP